MGSGGTRKERSGGGHAVARLDLLLVLLAANRAGVVIDGPEGEIHFSGDLAPGLAGGAAVSNFFPGARVGSVERNSQLAEQGAAAGDAVGFVNPVRVAVDGAEIHIQLLHDLLVAAALEEKLLDV